MDRRSFFGTLVGGIATTTAVCSWPFRVFSFPTEIVLADDPLIFNLPIDKFATIYYSKEALRLLEKNIKFEYAGQTFPLREPRGSLIRFREASWQT